MVLRLTSCSPRRSGSFVTVVSGYGFVENPVGPIKPPRNLTPASRRQNHTTSPSATDISRQHAVRPLTGLINPPCHHLARPMLPRPPHPVPNVRDDRETPLCGTGR